MSIARRGFLRILGAAPVAAPVIAREAAAKAGLNVSGLGSSGMGMPIGEGGLTSSSEDGGWAIRACQKVFSKQWEDEKRREMLRWKPDRLDPDLASSRSFSLSTALRIQRERNIERYIQGEREDAQARFFGVFGEAFKP